MSGTDDDPLSPDPWLREALRHAPDAQAAPGAKLDDIILRMARAAAAPRPAPTPPRPPTLGERFMAAWDWLARPPVAAGFASVLVATVAGVMWWGRPLQDALPSREVPPESMAAAEAASAPPPEHALAKAAPAAPAPAPAAVVAAAPTHPPAAAATPTPAPERRSADAARQAEPAAPPAAKMARAEAGVPAAAPAQDNASAERARSLAAAPTLADAAKPGALAAPAAAAAPAAVPPAVAGAMNTRAAAGSIETPGLSNLRFEIKPKPQAWTWQRNDGAERPMDDAMQNWVGLADRTARPHWNPGTAAGEGASTTLRFLRDGKLKATLRIGPKGLRLDRGGTSESAELAGSQIAPLAAALDALGP